MGPFGGGDPPRCSQNTQTWKVLFTISPLPQVTLSPCLYKNIHHKWGQLKGVSRGPAPAPKQ